MNKTPTKAARKIGANMQVVLDAQVKLAESIKAASIELNGAIASIPDGYNDEPLKKQIKSIKESMPKEFDSTSLLNRIRKLESAKSEPVDAKKLKESAVKSTLESEEIATLIRAVGLLKNDIQLIRDDLSDYKLRLSTENKKMKETLKLNQFELRSARDDLGRQVDEIRIQLNDITEIK